MDDGHQLALDGSIKVYYNMQPINLLEEHDIDTAEEIVTSEVDNEVSDLGVSSLSTKKLIDLDNDVIANEVPSDRISKRVYASVKDKIGARESKYIHSRYGFIQPIPRKRHDQTETIFMSGSKGSGKSTAAARYALNYQAEYPGNKVFLISRKDFDPAYDNVIPDLIRIKLDRNFIRTHMQRKGMADPIKAYSNSLVIFDDFMKIEDPTLRNAIIKMKNSLFELGRQYDTQLISIQHKALGGNDTKTELCESNNIVIFPRENIRECKEVLKKYLCFSHDDMRRIFDREGKEQRWMWIVRPNIIITEDYIKIID